MRREHIPRVPPLVPHLIRPSIRMKLLLMQPQLRAFDTAYCLEVTRTLLTSMRQYLDPSTIVLLPEHIVKKNDR